MTTIDAQQTYNLTDIEAFIAGRLNTPELAQRLAASQVPSVEVQRRLCEAGAGNFLYVKMALQDIERDNVFLFIRMKSRLLFHCVFAPG